MDRRGLLKAAGLCLAAAVLPRYEWSSKMRYGDLLAKLASGQQLTPGEQEELRLQGNQQESAASQMAGWTGANGTIEVAQINARRAEFEYGPPVCAFLLRDGAQSLANGALEDVQWEAKSGDWSHMLTWSSGTPTEIGVSESEVDQGMLLLGYVTFAANSSGLRQVNVGIYLNGVWYQETVACVGAADGVDTTVVPFCYLLRLSRLTTKFKITVKQTSGAALNATYNRIDVMKIRRS